jgi:hypothetical protein
MKALNSSRWLILGTLLVGMTVGAQSSTASTDSYIEPKPPTLPKDATGKDAVKTYLLSVADACVVAAKEMQVDAAAYNDLVAAHGNSVADAAKAEPEKMGALLHRLRNEYKRIDSYGYEYIEGIVAGVPVLIKYDVELDSGVPEKKASLQDQVADIQIKAGDITINKEGSLNNFLIEPTVYGTNPRFVAPGAESITLPGFDKPVALPRPALVKALADYAVGGYTRLAKDSRAWQPTDRDFFQAMVNMTPTLADYFDDWKESKKYGKAEGGRFVAVSRVSDMRGIMSSTQLTWLTVRNIVHTKDPALADKITQGYEQVMRFIDTVDQRDQKRPLKVETIDALGAQAKERADRLTVQVAQAASLLKIDVNSK